MAPYRVFVTGDFHIPFRAREIPKELLEFLDNTEVDLVAITGDLVQSYVLQPFKKYKLKVVRGNMDIGDAEKFPLVETISFPEINYKAILFHGTGIYPRGEPMLLRAVALKYKANVIITGHTHVPDARKIIDTVIINPGSGTGVHGGSGGFGHPTWALVEFDPSNIHIQVYAVKYSRKDKLVELIIDKTFDIP